MLSPEFKANQRHIINLIMSINKSKVIHIQLSAHVGTFAPRELARKALKSWSWMWIVLREQSMILHKWGYTQHDERESSSVFSQEDEIKLWTAGRRNYVNVVYISASRKYKNSPTYLCQHPKWSVELILVRITDFGKVKSTSWLMAPKCSCIEISPCIQSQVLSYFIHSHWHWNGTTVAFGEIIVADDIHRLGAS